MSTRAERKNPWRVYFHLFTGNTKVGRNADPAQWEADAATYGTRAEAEAAERVERARLGLPPDVHCNRRLPWRVYTRRGRVGGVRETMVRREFPHALPADSRLAPLAGAFATRAAARAAEDVERHRAGLRPRWRPGACAARVAPDCGGEVAAEARSFCDRCREWYRMRRIGENYDRE